MTSRREGGTNDQPTTSRSTTPQTNRTEQADAGALALHLGIDVYDFLTEAADGQCMKALVLGGGPCGKCVTCKAKVLETKIRDKYVRLGWSKALCPSCKGSGVKKL